MSERDTKTPDIIDPKSGYPFFWQSEIVSRNALHSLVIVPMEDPVAVNYRNFKSGVDYFFNPTDSSQDWILEGTVSKNTLNSLKMLETHGYKSIPTVTENDLKYISEYGKIESSDNDNYRVALWLPEAAILSLLHYVWTPPTQKDGSYAPAYRLRDYDRKNRVLPQKLVADPLGHSPRSIIQVVRK